MEKETINQQFLRLKTIWVSIFLSLFIYLFLAKPVENAKHIPQYIFPEENSLIRVGLYLIAVIIFATSFLFKKAIYNKSKLASKYNSETSREIFFKRYFLSVFISLVLSELIAIFGLVYFFCGKEILDFYIMVGSSGIAMILHIPKKSEIS